MEVQLYNMSLILHTLCLQFATCKLPHNYKIYSLVQKSFNVNFDKSFNTLLSYFCLFPKTFFYFRRYVLLYLLSPHPYHNLIQYLILPNYNYVTCLYACVTSREFFLTNMIQVYKMRLMLLQWLLVKASWYSVEK